MGPTGRAQGQQRQRVTTHLLYPGTILLLQGLCANTVMKLLDLKVSRPALWVGEGKMQGPRAWDLDSG